MSGGQMMSTEVLMYVLRDSFWGSVLLFLNGWGYSNS